MCTKELVGVACPRRGVAHRVEAEKWVEAVAAPLRLEDARMAVGEKCVPAASCEVRFL